MSEPKTTGEVLNLVCKDGIRVGLPDQSFNEFDVAQARRCLNPICLRETRAGSRHISKPPNPKRIAPANEKRTTAILREDPCPRLYDTETAQRT